MATINLNSAMGNNQSIASFSVRKEAKPLSWGIMSGCKDFVNNGEKRPLNVKEAIEAVSANYKVEKQHLVRVPNTFIESIKSGKPYMGSFSENDIVTSHMATCRTDNNCTLGVVGANYGIVQNEKAFEFIDVITSGELGGLKPIIETAGVLGNGERIYVTAKMPKSLTIGDNDKDAIDDYILFTNSHDGSGAVTALFTPIRVICQNSLNLALRQAKNKLIFKHTAYVNTRLDWENKENIQRAVAVLQMHEKYNTELLDKLYGLSQEKIDVKNGALEFSAKVMASPSQVKLLQLQNMNLDRLTTEEMPTRTKNNILSLCDAIESGVGQEQYRGTKLWLYNGLTSYLGNNRAYKSEEEKMKSIMLGGDANKKAQHGFEILYA